MSYSQINKCTDFFNNLLYTGNNTSPRSITGVGFQPDLVWIKDRSDGSVSPLADSVRGANKSIKSSSDAADETNSSYGYLTSFDSDGFSMAIGSSDFSRINENSNSYVAWNWKAGTSFTNDASATSIGTIDSSGSFNNDSGFSIVTYSATGSAGTIKHGLNAVPQVVLTKSLGSSAWWGMYHHELGNTHAIYLNQNNGKDASSTYWNNTSPTSSVFSVGTNSISNGSSGGNYIAYCFAEKPGFSKFGKYKSNSGSNNMFIFTGFAPIWLLIKRADSTDAWILLDAKRNSINGNPNDDLILPNSNSAELANNINKVDFLSNGFKVRPETGATATGNGSTDDFIYLAFGQTIVGSNNIPTTGR
tara:strand:- start:1688 stop:2770 length:1083 start_codon:yes stop_codon:yes gene_type:complete